MKGFVIATSAVVLAVSGGTVSADTVKIGLIASYTGAFATWGTQFQQAIEAYQSVNGKTVKGPDGKTHEIQFVYRDSGEPGSRQGQAAGGGAGAAREGQVPDRFRAVAACHGASAKSPTQAKIPVVIMNAATASIARGSPYYRAREHDDSRSSRPRSRNGRSRTASREST